MEVLITIILMGLLFGIASSVLFGVVDGRRVDSATNQLAADLRLAHTRATNRLEQWQVVLTADSSTYTIGPVGAPSTRDLDDDPAGDEVVVDTTAPITFEPDGSAVLPGDAPLIVSSADDGALNHEIEINAATSRIQIDP
jgi:Tfp pilus assembly protein FimT